MNFHCTAREVAMIVAMLPEDDVELRADMLEGETDLYEMIERILAWIEEDEGNSAALEKQIMERKIRLARFEGRIERKREMISALLDIAKLNKIELPEATISKRLGKAKLVIVSDDAVPSKYQATKKSPNKSAINTAFEEVEKLPNWLIREDPKPILTVRRR